MTVTRSAPRAAAAPDFAEPAETAPPPRRAAGWRAWVGGEFRPPYAVPWRAMLVVFLVAFVLRAAFLAGELEVQSAASIRKLYGDSPEYLELAHAIADHDAYTLPHLDGQVTGLVRTPLYPAVIGGWLKAAGALGLSDKWAYGATFYTQAAADAALCAIAGLLAWMVWRQRWLAWVVGLFSAVSMTGIGLSGTIMTDGPFAFWAVAGAALTLWAAARRAWWPAALAGLAWAAATYTKPTTTLWPPGLAVMWVLACLGRDLTWRRSLVNLGVCLAVFLTPVLAWCVHNKLYTGVGAFSIVSERNLRYMVAPRIDEWREYGIFPEGKRLRRRYQNMGKIDRRSMREPDMTPAEFVRRQRAANWEQVWTQPGWLLRVMRDNFASDMEAGWDVLHRQLPPADDLAFGAGGYGPAGVWTEPLRQVYHPLVWLDREQGTRWVMFALMCGAVPAAWGASLFPRRGRRERVRWAARASAVWVLAAYFLATGATTVDQGSRILYPYAPLAAALAAGWLALLLPPYRVADGAADGAAEEEAELEETKRK